MEISQLLGDNVRARRKALGLSLEKLAEIAGITWHAIQQVETAKSWPTPKTIAILARALECEPHELFAGSAPRPTPEQALEVLAEAIRRPKPTIREATLWRTADNLTGKLERVPQGREDVLDALRALPEDDPRWASIEAVIKAPGVMRAKKPVK